jgi:hypothetical protein
MAIGRPIEVVTGGTGTLPRADHDERSRRWKVAITMRARSGGAVAASVDDAVELRVEPGRVMSPDELAQHAWGVGYHAVRHRSRLVVSIKRLRDALHGEAFAAVDGGYRLSAPVWAVLEPINRASPTELTGPVQG